MKTTNSILLLTTTTCLFLPRLSLVRGISRPGVLATRDDALEEEWNALGFGRQLEKKLTASRT